MSRHYYKRTYHSHKRVKTKNQNQLLSIICSIIFCFVLVSFFAISVGYNILPIFFIFVIITIISICVYNSNQTHRRNEYLSSPLYVIDKMKGTEFEKYLKAEFEFWGYHVSLTSNTGDFGADLVCKKNGETLLIQAKRYKDKKVSVEAVQQIIGPEAVATLMRESAKGLDMDVDKLIPPPEVIRANMAKAQQQQQPGD